MIPELTEEDTEVLAHYLEGVFIRDRHGRVKGIVVLKLKGKEDGDGVDQE